jgi:hypothetical protein
MSASYLPYCVNTVQKVDVAQWVDGSYFPVYEYTAAAPEEQTTVSRIVPSYLLTGYNGCPLGDCSKVLRFRNI